MEFLDQLALEQKGFRLAAHDMDIKIVDGIDERVKFQIPSQSPRWMKILRDALAQIACFSDVNYGPESILHQVHTRLVWHGAKLVSDVIGNRHDARKYTQKGGQSQESRGRKPGIAFMKGG